MKEPKKGEWYKNINNDKLYYFNGQEWEEIKPNKSWFLKKRYNVIELMVILLLVQLLQHYIG